MVGVEDPVRTAAEWGGRAIERGVRNRLSLSSKEAVEYQTEPSGDQQCSNCNFYIPDENDDGQGACAVVAGTIAPDAWCVSYVRYQE